MPKRGFPLTVALLFVLAAPPLFAQKAAAKRVQTGVFPDQSTQVLAPASRPAVHMGGFEGPPYEIPLRRPPVRLGTFPDHPLLHRRIPAYRGNGQFLTKIFSARELEGLEGMPTSPSPPSAPTHRQKRKIEEDEDDVYYC